MLSNKKISVQGHRGSRGLYPENTTLGFIEAIKAGADTIEMDVVISKDYKVVVSHEAWMNAVFCTKPDQTFVTDASYNLFEMSYEEIKKFDCGKRKNPKFALQNTSAQYKPLLSEVIKKTKEYTTQHHLPDVIYNIEIKSEENTDNLNHPNPIIFSELVYKEVKHILPQIILQSFDVRILQHLHSMDSTIALSLLVDNKEDLNSNINHLGFTPAIYGPQFKLVNEDLVLQLNKLNIKLMPWTVNEIEDMKKLIGFGVDSIITDYPEKLVQLLKN